MARKRYTVEQIIAKLREAEVELSKGLETPEVCRKLGVSENTYYRWRKEYGGLRTRSVGPAGSCVSLDRRSDTGPASRTMKPRWCSA